MGYFKNKEIERLGEPEYLRVLDSGTRESFDTGSVRDTREGKGRYDLITPIGLKRLAQHYANGAVKYGDRNWEKGQPISRYVDSAIRHLYAFLDGGRDEDHLAATAWNALAAIHTEEMVARGELPNELNDLEVKDERSTDDDVAEVAEDGEPCSYCRNLPSGNRPCGICRARTVAGGSSDSPDPRPERSEGGGKVVAIAEGEHWCTRFEIVCICKAVNDCCSLDLAYGVTL